MHGIMPTWRAPTCIISPLELNLHVPPADLGTRGAHEQRHGNTRANFSAPASRPRVGNGECPAAVPIRRARRRIKRPSNTSNRRGATEHLRLLAVVHRRRSCCCTLLIVLENYRTVREKAEKLVFKSRLIEPNFLGFGSGKTAPI